MDTEKLVQLSPVIIRGEVESIVSGADLAYSQIHTYVTIRIEENLRGAEGLARVTLEQLGGSVDGYTTLVFGMPSFYLGERVVVFARPTERDTLAITGLFQGSFRIDSADGQDLVQPGSRLGGGIVLGRSAGKRAPRPVGEFLAEVRGRMKRHPAGIARRFRSSFSAAAGRDSVFEFHEKFEFLGPTRWVEPDDGDPVIVHYNPDFAPAVVPDGERNEFVKALAAWSNVEGASITLADGGNTAARCFRADGVTAISHDPCPEDGIPPFNSTFCFGVLAIGGISLFSTQTTRLNDVDFLRTLEGDVVFNRGADCFWSRDESYEETLAHEMGHMIGLGHSQKPEALMYAFAHGDGRGADLRDDDIDGVRFIYPPDGFVDAYLNKAAFRTGETIKVFVDANGTEVVDVYLAAILPDGGFVTVGEGGVLSTPNRIVPLVTDRPLAFFDDELIFNYVFKSSDPAGSYLWTLVLAKPGSEASASSNWIAFDTAAFNFFP